MTGGGNFKGRFLTGFASKIGRVFAVDLLQPQHNLFRNKREATMVPFQNQNSPMPNLSIKNVPEDVVARLRARARANHRSLQGELLELACQAATGSDLVPASEQHLRREPDGHKTIEQIAAERKARRETPVSDVAQAVELIRRDRDAR